MILNSLESTPFPQSVLFCGGYLGPNASVSANYSSSRQLLRYCWGWKFGLISEARPIAMNEQRNSRGQAAKVLVAIVALAIVLIYAPLALAGIENVCFG